jgi:SM-20-related protein
MTLQQIASEMEKSGYCVCPDFYSKAEIQETRSDLDRAKAAGCFHLAGIGQAKALVVNESVRRDEICWLDRGSSNPTQDKLWARLDSLMEVCNAPPLYLGLKNFEGHYASYGKGGFYTRHRDAFAKNKDRVVTFILYLNFDWKSEDGGCLRIFHDQSKKSGFDEVKPVGGTMVCFLSDEFDHEVRTSYADRHSFTGWYKRS